MRRRWGEDLKRHGLKTPKNTERAIVRGISERKWTKRRK